MSGCSGTRAPNLWPNLLNVWSGAGRLGDNVWRMTWNCLVCSPSGQCSGIYTEKFDMGQISNPCCVEEKDIFKIIDDDEDTISPLKSHHSLLISSFRLPTWSGAHLSVKLLNQIISHLFSQVLFLFIFLYVTVWHFIKSVFSNKKIDLNSKSSHAYFYRSQTYVVLILPALCHFQKLLDRRGLQITVWNCMHAQLEGHRIFNQMKYSSVILHKYFPGIRI